MIYYDFYVIKPKFQYKIILDQYFKIVIRAYFKYNFEKYAKEKHIYWWHVLCISSKDNLRLIDIFGADAPKCILKYGLKLKLFHRFKDFFKKNQLFSSTFVS